MRGPFGSFVGRVLARGGGVEDRNVPKMRDELSQKVEPLRAQIVVGEGKPGDTPAGMGEGVDESRGYRITGGEKDDGH